MHREPPSRPSEARELRVLLVDSHEVSRAACRALLRTEGVDVVADVPVGEDAIVVAGRRPNTVIVDVAPDDHHSFAVGERIGAMPHGPAVVLTSSAERSMFEARLDGLAFVAKADICAAEVLAAVRVTGERPVR